MPPKSTTTSTNSSTPKSNKSNNEVVNDILISAVLLLDLQGERILTKYFPNPNISMKSRFSLDEQLAIERALTTNASRSTYRGDVDICVVDELVGVFAQHDDVRVFVLVDLNESETIASMVLSTLSQALQYLFDFRVNKANILTSADLVMFLLDECIDNGYILELDVDEVIKRVSMKDEDEFSSEGKKFQQSDTSLTNALSRAFGW